MANTDAGVADGGVESGGRAVADLPYPGPGEEGARVGPTGRALTPRTGAAVPVAAPAAYAGVSGLRKATAGAIATGRRADSGVTPNKPVIFFV